MFAKLKRIFRYAAFTGVTQLLHPAISLLLAFAVIFPLHLPHTSSAVAGNRILFLFSVALHFLCKYQTINHGKIFCRLVKSIRLNAHTARHIHKHTTRENGNVKILCFSSLFTPVFFLAVFRPNISSTVHKPSSA